MTHSCDPAILAGLLGQWVTIFWGAVLSDVEFLTGIQEGYEEIERGERMSLADLKRELGLD